jgi:outer membrane lipoprotein-sorting protein
MNLIAKEMKKTTLFLMITMLVPAFIHAQEKLQDPEAKKIIDAFGEKMKKNSPMKIDFTYSFESLQTDDNFEEKGTIIIDDGKYKLNVMESLIYFDGETMWNYLPEVDEVNITEPDPTTGDEFLSNPASFFQVYNKDFKYRLLGSKTFNNNTFYEIDLYPMDLEKDYSRVKLLIEKANLQLYSAQIFFKSGDIYTLQVNNLVTNYAAPGNFYKFNVNDHPEAEVIDMRF